jgi:metal-responsive CopG/Arc/MetJ family transcriptional regulator
MPILTIRLPDKILHEVDLKSRSLHVSKNAYIQKAINNLNEQINWDIKRKRLIKASQEVRSNSMEVNNEFSVIENDPEV